MPKNKYLRYLIYVAGTVFFFLLIIDYILLPLYVSGSEHQVPYVVGKQKDEAIKILQDAGLTVVQTSRFDRKYQKDHVIFQKPAANSIVKSNRRIYIIISSGDQLEKMTSLIGKTIRDAKVSLERLGFTLGKIDSTVSEFPADVIVEQQYVEGREVAKGTSVNVKISIGPQSGMIRVPNILAKSLSEADKLLKSNNLKIGFKTYIHSPSMLPNTIVDQQPGEGTLLKLGDSVNVVLTQSKPGDKK